MSTPKQHVYAFENSFTYSFSEAVWVPAACGTAVAVHPKRAVAENDRARKDKKYVTCKFCQRRKK